MKNETKRYYTPRKKKIKRKNINEIKRRNPRSMIPMTKKWNKQYWIDRDGNVFNIFGKKMTSKINNKGYYHVNLTSDTYSSRPYSVHRLLYQTFIGELISGLVIDHINGIRHDNRLENLQQITQHQNCNKGKLKKYTDEELMDVFCLSWSQWNNKWQKEIPKSYFSSIKSGFIKRQLFDQYNQTK